MEQSDQEQRTHVSAKSRYQALTQFRTPFLGRFRALQAVTIPSLIPEHDDVHRYSGSALQDPHQSLGARCVNVLAGKTLMALLPPNVAFYRYVLPPEVEELLDQGQDKSMRQEVEKKLSRRESLIMREIDLMRLRSSLYHALRHMIVGGNALLYVPNDGPSRYYGLHQYVVERDANGDVLLIILKERVSKRALTQKQLDALPADLTKKPDEHSPSSVHDDLLDLYTVIERDAADKKWETWQEIDSFLLPDSKGHHPIDDPQWLALRWTRRFGEDYGYGHCEDYAGDLIRLEALSQATQEAALGASQVRFGVRPNASVTPQDMAKVPNMGFFEGEEGDFWALRIDKQADFAFAAQEAQAIRQSLGAAFLLNSAMVRDAERVTAEEVRFVAGEVEGIGGPYTLLADEIQRPAVSRGETRVAKSKSLPALPKGIVPVIITGFEAMGRTAELQKVQAVIGWVTQALGPSGLSVLKPRELVKFAFTQAGINSDSFIMSDEEVAQQQQQAQQAKLNEITAPEVTKQLGQAMMAQQQPQQPQAQ